MNLALFYYNQLATQTQKKIYAHQLKHFLDEHLGLPYAIPIKVAKPQELLQVYNALFLDNTSSSLLPAMNTIVAYSHEDKCVLTSELEPCSINEDKEVQEILDVLRGKINNYSNSIFDKVTYATRLLSERTCYYLKNNGEGETPYSVLLKHSGYCTGIARTTRALLSNDSRRFMPFREIEFYQIASNKNIRVSAILAKSLGLNKEDVEKVNEKLNNEINEINKQLKTEYAILTDCLKEFNKIKKEIHNIFDEQEEKSYEIQERIDNEYKQFCRLLKDSIYRIGYYIDNEDTLLFFNKNDGYNRREFLNEYLNAKNPIWEAIHQFLLEQNYYKEEESILELDKIEESRLKYLEKKINKEFLSSLVSGFDKDEILGYRIAFNNKNVSIFVKEKSGEEIDINSTSLGRRWFLIYSFVKRLLKKGDFLFIDEPATFLHPQAQIEFRKDLEQLASNDVYVFITTHSPYMIPNNWANVHNVIMTEKGTQVQSFIDKDELCETIKEELGISRTSDILFNLSKTILLVEGVADKACIEKFARKLGYDLSNYQLIACHGSPIIGMTYLCIKENVNFKALLDADTKSKPSEWLKYKIGWREYIEEFTKNSNCVFTPEDGDRKCLEDCFSRVDAEKYFYEKKNTDGTSEMKIGAREIEEGEVFTDETLKNFEQLFIKLGIPKIDKK